MPSDLANFYDTSAAAAFQNPSNQLNASSFDTSYQASRKRGFELADKERAAYSSDERVRDTAILTPEQFNQKYGSDAESIRYQFAKDALAYRSSEDLASGSIGENVRDFLAGTAETVASVPFNVAALVPAVFGATDVANSINEFGSKGVAKSIGNFLGSSTREFRQQLRAEQGAVMEAINAQKEQEDIANGDSSFHAGLKRIGRDFVDYLRNGATLGDLADKSAALIGTGGGMKLVGAGAKGATALLARAAKAGKFNSAAEKIAKVAERAEKGEYFGGNYINPSGATLEAGAQYASKYSELMDDAHDNKWWENNSPAYRERVAAGENPEEVKQDLAWKAAMTTAIASGVAGGIGGNAFRRLAGMKPITASEDLARKVTRSRTSNFLHDVKDTLQATGVGAVEATSSNAGEKLFVNPDKSMSEGVGKTLADYVLGGAGPTGLRGASSAVGGATEKYAEHQQVKRDKATVASIKEATKFTGSDTKEDKTIPTQLRKQASSDPNDAAEIDARAKSIEELHDLSDTILSSRKNDVAEAYSNFEKANSLSLSLQKALENDKKLLENNTITAEQYNERVSLTDKVQKELISPIYIAAKDSIINKSNKVELAWRKDNDIKLSDKDVLTLLYGNLVGATADKIENISLDNTELFTKVGNHTFSKEAIAKYNINVPVVSKIQKDTLDYIDKIKTEAASKQNSSTTPTTNASIPATNVNGPNPGSTSTATTATSVTPTNVNSATVTPTQQTTVTNSTNSAPVNSTATNNSNSVSNAQTAQQASAPTKPSKPAPKNMAEYKQQFLDMNGLDPAKLPDAHKAALDNLMASHEKVFDHIANAKGITKEQAIEKYHMLHSSNPQNVASFTKLALDFVNTPTILQEINKTPHDSVHVIRNPNYGIAGKTILIHNSKDNSFKVLKEDPGSGMLSDVTDAYKKDPNFSAKTLKEKVDSLCTQQGDTVTTGEQQFVDLFNATSQSLEGFVTAKDNGAKFFTPLSKNEAKVNKVENKKARKTVEELLNDFTNASSDIERRSIQNELLKFHSFSLAYDENGVLKVAPLATKERLDWFNRVFGSNASSLMHPVRREVYLWGKDGDDKSGISAFLSAISTPEKLKQLLTANNLQDATRIYNKLLWDPVDGKPIDASTFGVSLSTLRSSPLINQIFTLFNPVKGKLRPGSQFRNKLDEYLNEALNNPALDPLKVDGKLPEAVKDILTFAVAQWASSVGAYGHALSDAELQDNGLFVDLNADSAKDKAYGVPAPMAIQNLVSVIQDFMAVAPTNKAAIQQYEKLFGVLAAATAKAAVDANIVNLRDSIYTSQDVSKLTDAAAREEAKVQEFVISDDYSGLFRIDRDILSRLLGGNFKREILLSPVEQENLSKKIAHTNISITPIVQRAINKANNTEYKIRSDFVGLMLALGGREGAHKWLDGTNTENPAIFNGNDYESQKGKENQTDLTFDFIESHMAADPNSLLSKHSVYFNHVALKNGRIMQEGSVTFQSSTLLRAGLSLGGAIINLASLNGDAYNNWLTAVAQNLGFKVGKTPVELYKGDVEILIDNFEQALKKSEYKTIFEKLDKSAKAAESAKTLNISKEDAKDFLLTEEDLNNLRKLSEEISENLPFDGKDMNSPEGIHTLQELRSFIDARKDKEKLKKFKTDLLIETDATHDGPSWINAIYAIAKGIPTAASILFDQQTGTFFLVDYTSQQALVSIPSLKKNLQEHVDAITEALKSKDLSEEQVQALQSKLQKISDTLKTLESDKWNKIEEHQKLLGMNGKNGHEQVAQNAIPAKIATRIIETNLQLADHRNEEANELIKESYKKFFTLAHILGWCKSTSGNFENDLQAMLNLTQVPENGTYPIVFDTLISKKLTTIIPYGSAAWGSSQQLVDIMLNGWKSYKGIYGLISEQLQEVNGSSKSVGIMKFARSFRDKYENAKKAGKLYILDTETTGTDKSAVPYQISYKKHGSNEITTLWLKLTPEQQAQIPDTLAEGTLNPAKKAYEDVLSDPERSKQLLTYEEALARIKKDLNITEKDGKQSTDVTIAGHNIGFDLGKLGLNLSNDNVIDTLEAAQQYRKGKLSNTLSSAYQKYTKDTSGLKNAHDASVDIANNEKLLDAMVDSEDTQKRIKELESLEKVNAENPEITPKFGKGGQYSYQDLMDALVGLLQLDVDTDPKSVDKGNTLNEAEKRDKESIIKDFFYNFQEKFPTKKQIQGKFFLGRFNGRSAIYTKDKDGKRDFNHIQNMSLTDKGTHALTGSIAILFGVPAHAAVSDTIGSQGMSGAKMVMGAGAIMGAVESVMQDYLRNNGHTEENLTYGQEQGIQANLDKNYSPTLVYSGGATVVAKKTEFSQNKDPVYKDPSNKSFNYVGKTRNTIDAGVSFGALTTQGMSDSTVLYGIYDRFKGKFAPVHDGMYTYANAVTAMAEAANKSVLAAREQQPITQILAKMDSIGAALKNEFKDKIPETASTVDALMFIFSNVINEKDAKGNALPQKRLERFTAKSERKTEGTDTVEESRYSSFMYQLLRALSLADDAREYDPRIIKDLTSAFGHASAERKTEDLVREKLELFYTKLQLMSLNEITYHNTKKLLPITEQHMASTSTVHTQGDPVSMEEMATHLENLNAKGKGSVDNMFNTIPELVSAIFSTHQQIQLDTSKSTDDAKPNYQITLENRIKNLAKKARNLQKELSEAKKLYLSKKASSKTAQEKLDVTKQYHNPELTIKRQELKNIKDAIKQTEALIDKINLLSIYSRKNSSGKFLNADQIAYLKDEMGIDLRSDEYFVPKKQSTKAKLITKDQAIKTIIHYMNEFTNGYPEVIKKILAELVGTAIQNLKNDAVSIVFVNSLDEIKTVSTDHYNSIVSKKNKVGAEPDSVYCPSTTGKGVIYIIGSKNTKDRGERVFHELIHHTISQSISNHFSLIKNNDQEYLKSDLCHAINNLNDLFHAIDSTKLLGAQGNSEAVASICKFVEDLKSTYKNDEQTQLDEFITYTLSHKSYFDSLSQVSFDRRKEKRTFLENLTEKATEFIRALVDSLFKDSKYKPMLSKLFNFTGNRSPKNIKSTLADAFLINSFTIISEVTNNNAPTPPKNTKNTTTTNGAKFHIPFDSATGVNLSKSQTLPVHTQIAHATLNYKYINKRWWGDIVKNNQEVNEEIKKFTKDVEDTISDISEEFTNLFSNLSTSTDDASTLATNLVLNYSLTSKQREDLAKIFVEVKKDLNKLPENSEEQKKKKEELLKYFNTASKPIKSAFRENIVASDFEKPAAFFALAAYDPEIKNLFKGKKISFKGTSKKSYKTLDGIIDSLADSIFNAFVDKARILNGEDASNALKEYTQLKESSPDPLTRLTNLSNLLDKVVLHSVISLPLTILGSLKPEFHASTQVPALTEKLSDATKTAPVYFRAGFNEALRTLVNKFAPDFLIDWVKEPYGRTPSNRLIQTTFKAIKGYLDKNRRDFIVALPKHLASNFKNNKISSSDKEFFDRSLAKTEIVNLKDANLAEKVLTSKSDLAKEIQSAEEELANTVQNKERVDYYKSKAKQLAKYVMHKENAGHNLLASPEYIACGWVDHNYGKKAATPSVVAAIEKLCTLYTINELSDNDVERMTKFYKTDKAAMDALFNQLSEASSKEEERLTKNGNSKYKANRMFGARWTGTSPKGEYRVIPEKDLPYFKKLGYIDLGIYKQSNIDASGKYHRIYTDYPHNREVQEGIVQCIDKTAYGYKVNKDTRNEFIGSSIRDNTALRYAANNYEKESTSTGTNGLIPIFNEKGEVIAFERGFDKQDAKYLDKGADLFSGLAQWRERQEREEIAKDINESIFQNLAEEYNNASAEERKQYVDVFAINNPAVKDAVSRFDNETLDQLSKAFGGKHLWIKRDEVSTVIGYYRASLSDMWDNKFIIPNKLEDTLVSILDAIFGEKSRHRVAALEAAIGQLATISRETIIIRSLKVPFMNIVGNVMLLWAAGMPINQIPKYVKQAIVSTQQYDTLTNQVRDFKFKQTEAKTQKEKDDLQQKINDLELRIKNLSVFNLIESGEYSSISSQGRIFEEVEMWKTNHLSDMIETAIEKSPVASRVAREVFLTKNSKAYEVMSKAVNWGDWIAKAALYTYLTEAQKEKGHVYTKDAARDIVSTLFVDYDQFAGRERDWFNKIGLTWFMTFKYRMIPALTLGLAMNPGRMGIATVLSNIIPFSAGTPLTDNFIAKLFTGGLAYSTGFSMMFNGLMMHPLAVLLGLLI